MTNRALSLIEGEALLRGTSSARVPSLAAQPFRPGELPESVLLELTNETARAAEARAARAGIPTELWLRIGVEAVRHVEGVASAAGVPTRDVIAMLDAAANQTESTAPVEARRQRVYARYLRTASARSVPRMTRRCLSLAVPDSILAAWSIDATTRELGLSDYVSDLATRVPPRVVEWEAKAAEGGHPLGEWIYAQAVFSFKRR